MDTTYKIDPLIELIKRLTIREKTFITKKLHASKSHKNHLILLQLVSKNISDNETELKTAFAKATKSKFYNVVKNQLQDLILRYLVELSSKQDIDSILLQQIAEAKVLLKKSLSKQAEKILKKALIEAENNELFYIKIHILELLVNLNLKFQPHNKLVNLMADLDTSMLEYANYGNVLKARMNLNEVHFEMTSEKLKNESFAKLQQKLEAIDPKGISSVKSRSIYYHILGFLSLTYTHDWAQARSAYNELVKGIEAHPRILNNSTEIYLSALHNLCLCYDKLGDAKNFSETLLKLKNFKVADESLRYIVVERYMLNLQSHLINAKRFEEAAEDVEKMKGQIFRYAGQFQPNLCISIFVNATLSNIMIGEYKNCIKWINFILNNKFFVEYKLQSQVRIYNLLAHYELEHFDYVESAIPSTIRFLAAHDCNNGLYKEMVTFFQEAVLEPDVGDTRKLFKALLDRFPFIETGEEPNEKEFKEILYAWVDKNK